MFFQKKIGPVFLKESNETLEFLTKMKSLSSKADGKLKEEINREIKLAEYGAAGESNIAFELKNNDIDMYILHDIYLEVEDLSAQIDYIVITRKRTYIIECKNLIGNIEIDSKGNFVRSYDLFGKKIKEGMYSPITQNERHRLVIKKLKLKGKGLIKQYLIKDGFDEYYKGIVVLANSKTYLNDKYAKKEIKNQVIRADQLIEYIKKSDKEIDYNLSNEEMLEIANFFINNNVENRSDYTKKYEDIIMKLNNKNENIEKEKILKDNSKTCPKCGNKLILRTAKKGENVGSQFYGCSNFPKCRYTEVL